MDLVFKVRDKKQILKNNKIRYRVVEGVLTNEQMIDLNTFLALLIISNKNFYYMDDKYYYSKLINPDMNEFCFVKKENDNYYLWLNKEIPDFKKLGSERLVKIDNLEKPLKPISHYKKPELEEWCKKWNIKYQFVGQKKLTKNKLYSLIQEKI